MSKERIIDKVRKLLALSTSQNVNEAASAAAAAQRLMNEHKLSETEISADATDDDLHEFPLGTAGFVAVWKFELATIVARSFFCEALGLRVGKQRKVRIIGLKEDAETAARVFHHLCREINRLARCELDMLIALSLEEGRSIRRAIDSFRRGAVHAVALSFQQEEKRFQASSEKALVISQRSRGKIHEHIHTRYKVRHRTIASPKRREFESAYDHGRVVGQEIRVTRSSEQGVERPIDTAGKNG